MIIMTNSSFYEASAWLILLTLHHNLAVSQLSRGSGISYCQVTEMQPIDFLSCWAEFIFFKLKGGARSGLWQAEGESKVARSHPGDHRRCLYFSSPDVDTVQCILRRILRKRSPKQTDKNSWQRVTIRAVSSSRLYSVLALYLFLPALLITICSLVGRWNVTVRSRCAARCSINLAALSHNVLSDEGEISTSLHQQSFTVWRKLYDDDRNSPDLINLLAHYSDFL